MTEPERWTDAEWAAEQVALARRQAEVARAEAREARAWAERCENLATAALEEARKLREDASTSEDARLKSIGDVLAERDKLRADLDHLHVGTIDHERMAEVTRERGAYRADLRWIAQAVIEEIGSVGPENAVDAVARLLEKYRETRAALEAARAAVHSPSPGVDDRRWSHPARDEGPDQRLVDGIVDAASAARRGAPRVVAEGRDPATRSRALPVVPAQPAECWTCEHEAGSYCYHPAHPLPAGYREIVGRMPPDWCPIRAELAKDGGA